MNPDEALALAKRMFQQLARLSPRGAAYRERAAVLVDVLAYAGLENEAQNLALALAGRYPFTEEQMRRSLFNRPLDPRERLIDRVPPAAEREVLQKEIDAVRQRVFGRPHYRKGPTKVRSPVTSFQSGGGRIFTIGDGVRVVVRGVPESTWPIFYENNPAGSLRRDSRYRPPLEWHASIHDLRWRGELPPIGIGYDVGAYETATECLAAWARSADQILDFRERRLSERE